MTCMQQAGTVCTKHQQKKSLIRREADSAQQPNITSTFPLSRKTH